MCELRKRHREGHQLTAHGIERQAHRFKGIGTQQSAVSFFVEDNRCYTDAILVLKQATPICLSMVWPFAGRNVCALRGLIPNRWSTARGTSGLSARAGRISTSFRYFSPEQIFDVANLVPQ